MLYPSSMFKVNTTNADSIEDVFIYFDNPGMVAALVYSYNTVFTALSFVGNIFIIFISIR